MPQEIFIILGSPNSQKGELSDISKRRLNYCVNNYQNGNLVLCTGGWGTHFNTSEYSHALIAKNYLIKNGIPENHFLEDALSSNTVDDAIKVKPILAKLKILKLTLITSDYHLDRVKMIFNEILDAYQINYIGVESKIKKDEFDVLVEHEKNAIESIVKNGLYY